MSDVWDLVDRSGGDHVLVALTVDECCALVRNARITAIDPAERSAIEQIRLSLRDQKDIDP